MSNMKMTPVFSSNIKSVGWKEEGEGTLMVEFTNGSWYKYFGVPETEYEALISARSVGAYLAANIKNKYTMEKM